MWWHGAGRGFTSHSTRRSEIPSAVNVDSWFLKRVSVMHTTSPYLQCRAMIQRSALRRRNGGSSGGRVALEVSEVVRLQDIQLSLKLWTPGYETTGKPRGGWGVSCETFCFFLDLAALSFRVSSSPATERDDFNVPQHTKRVGAGPRFLRATARFAASFLAFLMAAAARAPPPRAMGGH